MVSQIFTHSDLPYLPHHFRSKYTSVNSGNLPHHLYRYPLLEIAMRIFDIILLLCSFFPIRIYKVISTDIPLLHLAAVREFHYQLIPVPDKNCFFSIHSLASTQSLGIVSIVYLIHLSVTVPRAPWSLLYASPPKLVSYHFRWQVTTALR